MWFGLPVSWIAGVGQSSVHEILKLNCFHESPEILLKFRLRLARSRVGDGFLP